MRYLPATAQFDTCRRSLPWLDSHWLLCAHWARLQPHARRLWTFRSTRSRSSWMARAQQRLIVLGKQVDGRVRDLSREAVVTVEDTKFAAIRGGIVAPVGNGKTNLTIAAGSAKKIVPVSVNNATAATPVSFVREIVPILTKARLQLRRVPRRAARPGRLQAQPARLRSGLRSRADRAERRGPARRRCPIRSAASCC